LSYKKALIRLLDRPGGRFVLERIATHLVQRATGKGISIEHLDGLWTRRIGPDFLPDSLKFEYTYSDFGAWKLQMEQFAADTKEHWLQHYCPKKGDVIVDVGAGRGEDTLTFSRAVGECGRVIAIEAHPLSFAILKNFCRLNRLANVTPVHLALMHKAGTVQITESASWMENSINNSNGPSGVLVPAGTFKDVWEQEGLRNIAFMKMNIEGSERYALQGAGPIIQRVRQICVACHDFRSELGHGEQFRTRAFVDRFLVEHGFTVYSRSDDPRDYVRDHVFGLRPG
jgi:FkbM family methyltransferase